jgi:membrane-associated protein
MALPALMDPMYWLGDGGVFGSAVLAGVMIIIFIETGLLFRSHEFFERHGPKVLVIAQFIGVVRTYTPVAAGGSAMRYPVFLTFSVLGSIAWGVGLPVVGYFLGNIPFVSRHIQLIVMVIAVASAVPVIASAAAAFIRRRRVAAVAPEC